MLTFLKAFITVVAKMGEWVGVFMKFFEIYADFADRRGRLSLHIKILAFEFRSK